MMWVAIIYALIGSWLTYKIGRPLVRVNFDLERYNADFRYRMTRVRENAESIALYNGEPDERRRLGGRLRPHLRHLVGVHGLQQAADLAHRRSTARRQHLPDPGGQPALLRRRDPAGRADPDRQRLRLRPGLALLVRRRLARRSPTGRPPPTGSPPSARPWRAAKQRGPPRTRATSPSAPAASPGSSSGDVDVLLPNGRAPAGGRRLSASRRASGSSSRARPAAARPRSSACSPACGRSAGAGEPAGRRRASCSCRSGPTSRSARCARRSAIPTRPGLRRSGDRARRWPPASSSHLTERLDESANWSLMLSRGEQQRLAFARAVLVRPDWLFLDEATSALDEATETRLYELLRGTAAGGDAGQHRPQAQRRALPQAAPAHRPRPAPRAQRAAGAPGPTWLRRPPRGTSAAGRVRNLCASHARPRRSNRSGSFHPPETWAGRCDHCGRPELRRDFATLAAMIPAGSAPVAHLPLDLLGMRLIAQY